MGQRNETTWVSVKLKMEIDSGNKLKVLSKERQDEITRLNESRELSETIAEEKERKISCLKVNIKELKTSNEFFNKQLLQQRDETTELSVKLKTEIDSSDKLKILSKVNQDEITRLNELKEISEAMIVTEKNKFICSTQTISCLKEEITRLNESRELLEARAGEKESTITCLKEDIKTLEISKEDFNKQLLEQRDETAELTVKLKTEIDSGNKLKVLSKERQDEIT